jgi:hypothetical protein
MKRIVALLAAGVAGAVIALLALSLASRAFAQGPGGRPATAAPDAAPSGQMMGRGQMGGQAQSLVGMAAAELDVTQAELVAQLGNDGAIATALTAKGIDPAGFVDRFVATRATRLDAAVAAGTLTREDADARLATARSMAAARIAQPFTAPGAVGQGAGQGTCQGTGFVDADGDGICDHQPAAGQGPGFVDADGDGACDRQPAGGQGRQGRMGGRGGRP